MEKYKIKENKIKWVDLKHTPIYVKNVLNINSENAKYKIFPTYVEVEESEVYITYSYLPRKKLVEEYSDFDTELDKALVYDICSEYCLINGDYEKSKELGVKYKKVIIEYQESRS